MKAIRWIAIQKVQQVANPSSVHGLPKDPETTLMSSTEVQVVADHAIKALLQVAMPAALSDMAGKTMTPGRAPVAPVASAKKAKPSEATDASMPDDVKCTVLHWQKRAFQEAWLSVLRFPMSKVAWACIFHSAQHH